MSLDSNSDTEFELVPKFQTQPTRGDAPKSPELEEVSTVSDLQDELKSLRLENKDLYSLMEQLKKDNDEMKKSLEKVMKNQAELGELEEIRAIEDDKRSEKLATELVAIRADCSSLNRSERECRYDIERIFAKLEEESFFSLHENPIQRTISGTWKVIKISNFDEFFAAQDISQFHALIIKNQCLYFKVNKHQVKTQSYHERSWKPRAREEIHYFNFPNSLGELYSVEKNKLILTVTQEENDKKKVISRVERSVVDGQMKEIWERNGVICERIFKKIPDQRDSRAYPRSIYGSESQNIYY
ncbi:lipocalin/fatty-acid binding family protein [Caenorhabditis elegans]|uniref:Uncharacterized protein EEED8.2 n=1 Tax=Caenorhabditis elegans TaxID=6239 RepID=YQO2_CAEEL|nr:Uncharacterized protein CELE_EEED8.2 [Caenorhabditis elegans]Q09529.1 RecName: Full=Uncharacterized protein EEED8.2 [Caenorhabditis elegans]CCD68729.1 Uncharacterized protein CELE_EEED8.2 [Caenorhabditis elegans]|eukprot:NP_495026.1 Uncharacterized protein CELE_EEED8.2 [Caenorhabditis elegans]